MKINVYLILISIGFLSCTENKEINKPVANTQNGSTVFEKFFIEDSALALQTATQLLDDVSSGKIAAFEDEALSKTFDLKAFVKQKVENDTTFMLSDDQKKIDTIIKPALPFGPNQLIGFKIKSNFSKGKNGKYFLTHDAIAPLMDVFSDGIVIGQTPVFWIKYEDFIN